MARRIYGASAADYIANEVGVPRSGVELTVWTALTGGTQVTDLQTVAGAAITTVTSDSEGGIRFQGPDPDPGALFVEVPITLKRFSILPADLSARVATAETGVAAAVRTVNGATPDGAGNVVVSGGGSVVDATDTVKGIVQLAGDLAGTADAPTVPGLAEKATLAETAEPLTTVGTAGASQTLTLGPRAAGSFALTLTSASCAITLAGATAGKGNVFTVALKQDSTGGRLVTWPASVIWSTGQAPALSTAPNRTDIVQLVSFDGGASYLGALAGSNFAVPSTPNAPTGVGATAGNASATVTWTPPANASPAVTNYKVYRGTVSGTRTLLTTVGNVTSHLDSTAANGTTYYYSVSAVNSVGEGPQSTETAGVTPVSGSASLPATGTPASMWFKADAITGLADGALVPSWPDSSASNAPASNATAGQQPTYVAVGANGLPVVRFDGARKLNTATNVGPTFTVFVVAKQAATGAAHGMLGTASNGLSFTVASDNKLKTVKTAVAVIAASTNVVPSPTSAFHVFSARLGPDPGNTQRPATISVDGVENATTSPNPPSALAASIGMGQPAGNIEGFNGDIAEVVYYPASLSDTDRNLVKNYLAQKWGVTVA